MLNKHLALALFALFMFSGCEAKNEQTASIEKHKPKRYGTQVEQSSRGLAAKDLPGGDTTFVDLNPLNHLNANALSKPAANLNSRQRGLFAVGNSFFTNPWVSAPASTAARDGLGPLFNAAACQDCHIRDGRGHAPAHIGEPLIAGVIRIARQDSSADPVYGKHIQTRSLLGVPAEANVKIAWHAFEQPLPDGTAITMRKPIITVDNWQYGKPKQPLNYSLRIAPSMTGMGLLESIPAADIIAKSKQFNGTANRVKNLAIGEMQLGRFGWKANQPTVRQQALDAFNNDIGITSTLFPDETCTTSQTACQQQPNGGKPELADNIEQAVVFYSRHLAPPSRRKRDAESIDVGEKLFHSIGCASCHQPSWRTGNIESDPQLSNQLIWPYSDMLLHDMGEALADGIAEGNATGQHWRTAPLWAIGHAKTVGNTSTGYLHDGRALTIAEAIMWHGGEAESSRDGWAALTAKERRQVIQFINSL